ncbi:hypothetical protein D7Z26_25030 [Cohnella endophytica]|uniref:O-antigen ligase-related domain-containing protein n=1 Tax=Cohnella endophytica TaxID=2419778 RepID=A0A494X535_9BACL|nr:O-antigen ligase family protein [Cohnella endophytica]RKP45817.1 hypothetical protein D7Z26_25030 [Cohnella endophytica]
MNKSAGFKSVFSALIAIGVFAVLGGTAFRYGMFFDEDYYKLEMLLYSTVIAWLIYRTLRGNRSRSIWMYAWLPLGMCVLYGVELALGPASVKGTQDAVLRWLSYGCWTLLLSELWGNEKRRVWGWLAIQATGATLVIGGWLGWFGWISFTDIVLRFDDVELSATGARLAGFLQYPNAYGAVLAAFLIMQLQGAGKSKPRMIRWIAAMTAIPYGGALLLTESRGAIIVFAAGCALAYALAGSRSERHALLLSGGITAIGAAIVAKVSWHWMRSVGEESAGKATWGDWECWLGLGIMIVGAIVLFLISSPRAQGRREIPWLAAVTGTILAGWAAFDNAGARIAGHYGTVASRGLFYKDAWTMFRDSPLFGYGGKSWRALLGLYQSQPYVGNEVHSGYFEILLDTGLVGAALMLFMLIVYMRGLWRYRKQAIVPAAVLIAHAAIDFDWSYAFVWLLLLAWLMLHQLPRQAAEAQSGDELKRAPAALLPIRRQAAALLLIAIAAAGTWAAWRSDAAAQDRAAAAAAAPAAREEKLRAALEANPAWTRIRLELAPLLPLQERAAMLEAGLRYEPQAPQLHLQLGMAYAELGKAAQARDRLREAARLERFSREGQSGSVAALANLAARLRDDGDRPGAETAAEAAVAMFERYRMLVREVAEMPHPANGKQFGMTVAAKLNAAKSLLLLARVEEGKKILLEVIEEGDDDWKEEARKLLESLPER